MPMLVTALADGHILYANPAMAKLLAYLVSRSSQTSGEKSQAIEQVTGAARPLGGPFAVRSSAVDEDGAPAGGVVTLARSPPSR